MKIFECLAKCFNSKKEAALNDATGVDEKGYTQKGVASEQKDGQVSIDDFAKLDIRVGLVKDAQSVEGSDKLIKCLVNFGELGERTIVSGIKNYRAPEELVGKKFVYIVNLEPRKIFGVESQGMILAASDDNELAILSPDKDVEPGTKIS